MFGQPAHPVNHELQLDLKTKGFIMQMTICLK